MHTIEVTDSQYAYIEQLRSELQEQVVGRYGTCRDCDAVQFLIDNIDDDLDLSETFDTDALLGGDELQYDEDLAEEADTDDTDSASDGADIDDAATDETDDDSDDEGDESDDESADSGGTDAADDDDMLNEMMNLLDTHDDKWGESTSGDYRYEVDLPDGGTERAQTKDDVRAILFKQYR